VWQRVECYVVVDGGGMLWWMVGECCGGWWGMLWWMVGDVVVDCGGNEFCEGAILTE